MGPWSSGYVAWAFSCFIRAADDIALTRIRAKKGEDHRFDSGRAHSFFLGVVFLYVEGCVCWARSDHTRRVRQTKLAVGFRSGPFFFF